MRNRLFVVTIIFLAFMLAVPLASVSSADDDSSTETKSTFTSYYAQLDDNEKAVYDTLSVLEATTLSGTLALPYPLITNDSESTEILLNTAVGKIFQTAFFALSYDDPMAFCTWGKSAVISEPVFTTYSDGLKGVATVDWTVSVDPAYADDPKTTDINELQVKIDALKAAVADFDTKETTAKGIVEAINDFLTDKDRIRYDPNAEEEDESPYSHDAYGALVALTKDGSKEYHYAVCDGYSEAFQLLASNLKVTSVMIVGIAHQSDSSEAHAWNAVVIDDKWYGVDTTWNASTGDEYLFVGSLTKNSYGYTFAASHSPGVIVEGSPIQAFYTPTLTEEGIPEPGPSWIDEYGDELILIAIAAIFCFALIAMARGVK